MSPHIRLWLHVALSLVGRGRRPRRPKVVAVKNAHPSVTYIKQKTKKKSIIMVLGSSRAPTPTGKMGVSFRRQTEGQFVTVTTSDDHMASLQVFFENIVVAPTMSRVVQQLKGYVTKRVGHSIWQKTIF